MPPGVRNQRRRDVRRVSTSAHCAVLGSPVAHSLSPAMHRAAYQQLGLDWSYEAIDVLPGELAPFLDGLDSGWVGLSVTAPLKREAAECAVTRSAVVKQLGVANTLIGGPDGWHAVNTDVPGAVAALREKDIARISSVRFLGGGATVDSLMLAVRELGAVDLEVWVREPAKVSPADGVTVRRLGDGFDGPVDLLVSTIPASAVPADAVASAAAVFDVVYDPWPTPLASAAEASGLDVVTGLDLLAHQAALQVELMTGETVAPGVLREAALAALATD
ncbi:MAG TPA: shikimate dehydrogenase [Aeromicrobium sp.]|nr:shikimate dehydrogenase [Aeromicrobium sp.]